MRARHRYRVACTECLRENIGSDRPDQVPYHATPGGRRCVGSLGTPAEPPDLLAAARCDEPEQQCPNAGCRWRYTGPADQAAAELLAHLRGCRR